MTKPWHAMSVEEALKELKTNSKGLMASEAMERLRKYGYNELIERKRISPWRIFLNQFKDIFVIILLIAIIISIIIGYYRNVVVGHGGGFEEYLDAVTIGAILALNAVVGFVQEYRSEKAMDAIKKLTAPKARVIRDGQEAIIPAREVVPGDIISIEAGDKVPADARLIEIAELRTEEAALTGESTPVSKSLEALPPETPVSDRRNMVFMGTYAVYGRGKAVVVATGMKTEFGKIAEMVQEAEDKETPLKRKLENFAKKLGKGIIAIVIIIFLLEVVRGGAELEGVIEMFMTSVALAVAAVPEGLPAVVTVCLALGARELAKRNAILRRLSSAETLGSTTVICSDKTGTLTKGEMTVKRIYVGDKIIEVSGVGYEAKGEFLLDGKPIIPDEDASLQLLLNAVTLCNNARYLEGHVIGDTTEGALLVVAAKAGIRKENLEELYPRIHEIPFTSERKRMTTIHTSPEGKIFAYTKGAPEVVIERCSGILVNGEIKKLTPKEREEILRINEVMANNALRVLGVALKELKWASLQFDNESIESDMVFLGLVGMMDPPREEAKIAIKRCEEAGIKTVMITGDHKLTAVAVARELGIIKDKDDLVLTGVELETMSDTEFQKIVEKVAVYARVSPANKLRIVKALKNKGHIVAMTGDGVNDAPALKQSDIGIAMGITGTDVTKEAADLVLADDNFATIVNAVEGGRVIYDNIRKFTFYLLRCNLAEITIMGSFALLGLELPLTAAMLLWINLVTDGGPAVALSVDPPVDDVMKRPPRNPNESILHGRFASIIVTVATQCLGTGLLFYVAYYIWGEPLAEARTLAFAQITLQELVIVWNCRSETKNAFKVGFTSNKLLLISVIVSAALTAIIPYIGLFGTAPMTLQDWALVIPISLSGFILLPEIFYGRRIWKWR